MAAESGLGISLPAKAPQAWSDTESDDDSDLDQYVTAPQSRLQSTDAEVPQEAVAGPQAPPKMPVARLRFPNRCACCPL